MRTTSRALRREVTGPIVELPGALDAQPVEALRLGGEGSGDRGEHLLGQRPEVVGRVGGERRHRAAAARRHHQSRQKGHQRATHR